MKFLAPRLNRSGFTMVEIAICIAIIGFALVGIIGVLPIGLNAQRDNREETIINFDAGFLMDAIRNGAQGEDDLTNYALNVTISSTYYTFVNPTNNTPGTTSTTVYAPGYYAVNGSTNNTPTLTNGAIILGLLTTPKYVSQTGGDFISNYVTADFRALTGSPMDQATSQSSYDFAFSYRIFAEVVPAQLGDYSRIDSGAGGISPQDALARSNTAVLFPFIQNGFYDVRLRFRWPILPSGKQGDSVQTYRSAVAGQFYTGRIPANTNQPVTYFMGAQVNNALQSSLYLFQPQSFVNAPKALIFPSDNH